MSKGPVKLAGQPFDIGRGYGRAIRPSFAVQAEQVIEQGMAERGFLSIDKLRVAAEGVL